MASAEARESAVVATDWARSQSGQATVEAVALAPALAVILTVGLALAYLSFAKTWIARCTYESLVCLSTSTPASKCERDLRLAIASALPIGAVSSIHATRNSRRGSLDIRFSLDGHDLIRHKARLAYPLISPMDRGSQP